jgi:hypothetical protein
MTNTIWTGTCAAIVGAATAVMMAQTTSPQQSNASSSDRHITVTGCLKAAPQSSSEAAGTTGTAGTTAGTSGTTGTTGTTGSTATQSSSGAAADQANATFLLTDAAPGTEASGAASTTAGAAAETSSGTSAKTYRLIANPSALSPHVGKKLELTGTLEDQSAATAPAGSSAAGSEANAPALKVESGKVLAATCPER